MRNLKKADFSKEKASSDIPYGGSNTSSNQPHSPSGDSSMIIPPKVLQTQK